MSENGEINYAEFCEALRWLVTVSENIGDSWILIADKPGIGLSEMYLSRRTCKQLLIDDTVAKNTFNFKQRCSEDPDEITVSDLCCLDISGLQYIPALDCECDNGTNIHQEQAFEHMSSTQSTDIRQKPIGHTVAATNTDIGPNCSDVCVSKRLCTCQVEHHILYSHSYCVPVVYFNIYKSGGELLSLSELWSCIPGSVTGKHLTTTDLWSLVTQQEHPVLHRPYFYLHPCHTAQLMKQIHSSSSARAYLLSWLTTVAPTVQLEVSLRYATELITNCS